MVSLVTPLGPAAVLPGEVVFHPAEGMHLLACTPPAPAQCTPGPCPHPGPRYVGYGGFFAAVYLIYHAKPREALDIKYWARPRAEDELRVENRMLDKLSSRPDLQDRLQAVGKQLKLIDDEMYDLVLMRKEYKVLMGLHDGRVPAELKDIYDELQAE